METALVAEAIQRAHFRQHTQLRFLNSRHAAFQIIQRRKWTKQTLANNFRADFRAQTFYVAQPQPHRELPVNLFQRTQPVRTGDINGAHAQTVALRIGDQRGRLIKTHGLIVKHGRRKSREVVTLQIRAGIGDQRKAGGVRLGKSIQGEGSNGANNSVLRFPSDAVFLHAPAQLVLDFLHAFFRALEAEGP